MNEPTVSRVIEEKGWKNRRDILGNVSVLQFAVKYYSSNDEGNYGIIVKCRLQRNARHEQTFSNYLYLKYIKYYKVYFNVIKIYL